MRRGGNVIEARRGLALVGTILALSACGALVGVTDLEVLAPGEVPEDAGTDVVDLDVVRLDYDTGAPPPPPVDAGCPVKSIGPVGPTMGLASDNPGTGAIMAFQNLSGIKVPDDKSELTLPALVAGLPHKAQSELLTLWKFHANVPANAKVITGLKLELVGAASGEGADDVFFDAEVRAVIVDTTKTSLNRAAPEAWPVGPPITRVYGRDTEMWELPLSADLLNTDSFGFAIRFKKDKPNNAPVLKLDAMKLTVFYCE